MAEIDRDNEQFNEGVLHTVDLLAKALGVTDYVAGDGSEDYDQDLTQTMLNILTEKGLFDPETASFSKPSADGSRCPSCLSPAQHLHPAVQVGGEVQPCIDRWHHSGTRVNLAGQPVDAITGNR